MATKIDYDHELQLSAPDNGHLKSILVDVDLPKNAECLIFGMTAQGTTQSVRVKGGHSQVKLPFVSNRVFVKYLGDAHDLRLGTIGYIDQIH